MLVNPINSVSFKGTMTFYNAKRFEGPFRFSRDRALGNPFETLNVNSDHVVAYFAYHGGTNTIPNFETEYKTFIQLSNGDNYAVRSDVESVTNMLNKARLAPNQNIREAR